MMRATAVVAVTLAALVMAGCSPEPEPVATPSAPTAEPSPTPEAAVRPNPVFALTCAEVFSVAEVQAAITAPIAVKRDETNVSAEFWQLPLLTDGALSCRWGGENRTGTAFDDGVDVLVLPDGVDDYEVRAQSGPVASVDVAGADAAASLCGFGIDAGASGAPGYCTVYSLVGTTLIELRFSDSQGSYPTEEALRQVAIGLTESAVARVESAGPREQEWTPPASSLRADSAFCDAARDTLLPALGVATEFGGARDYDEFPGASVCEYFFGATDVYSVAIVVVSDAAWVAGVSQTESPALGQPYEQRSTASGSQWWLSPSGESVRGRAAVDGSLIEVIVYWGDIGITVEQAQQGITAFMEEYAEVPPGT